MNRLQQNMIEIYQAKGQKWIENLPALVQDLANQWALQNLHSLENLTYNYVLRGKQNSTSVILKLGLDKPALANESKALRAFEGFGSAQLLNEDLQKGALLLEELTPGTSLKKFFLEQEQQSLIIVSKVIKRLHQAPIPFQNSFPTLEQWISPLFKNWDILTPFLAKARIVAQQLFHSSPKPVMLHGDLHHDNILLHGKKWRVIDPKGIIGDRVYDICNFIINPMKEMSESKNLENIITNRINFFQPPWVLTFFTYKSGASFIQFYQVVGPLKTIKILNINIG